MIKKTKLLWAFERASEARPEKGIVYRVEDWLGMWTPIINRAGLISPLSDPYGKKQEAKKICEAHYQTH
jgi:hypothetical protein